MKRFNLKKKIEKINEIEFIRDGIRYTMYLNFKDTHGQRKSWHWGQYDDKNLVSESWFLRTLGSSN